VQSAELVRGRRIGVVLHSGDEVLSSIAAACVDHGITQAVIPVFLGAFRSARFIASHHAIDDQEVPLGDSTEVAYVEGIGSGSITWNASTGRHHVHLHVAVGVKDQAAAAYAGHLLEATTHYVAEIVIDEVLSPTMTRVPDAGSYGLANLHFAQETVKP
jgi:predicted DNA-binding protein with PD1-like motif